VFLSQIAVAPVFGLPPGHFKIFDVKGAGTDSGEGTIPDALNASSASTGYYIDSDFSNHGFLRASDGTVATFDVDGPSSQTQPSAINRKGTVAGFYLKPKRQIHYNGFLRKSSGTIDKFKAGGANTGVSGLNDNGDAVGNYSTRKHHIIGYLRAADGSVTDFRDPKAGKGEFEGTFVYGINDAGAIAGQFVRRRGTGGFIRNTDGTFTNFEIAGAGTLGIYPSAINQEGWVAGFYFDPNQALHAFIRDPAGTITTFDVHGAGTGADQGTSTSSIADDGTVAGSYVDSNNVSHGFLRLKNGTIKAFDAPGAGTGSGEGTIAVAINELHVTVGYEIDGSGVFHGFLRTP
jgi:hypothetical protein